MCPVFSPNPKLKIRPEEAHKARYAASQTLPASDPASQPAIRGTQSHAASEASDAFLAPASPVPPPPVLPQYGTGHTQQGETPCGRDHTSCEKTCTGKNDIKLHI